MRLWGYLIPRRITSLSRNVPTGFFALNQAATSAKTAGTASADNIAKRAVCCYDTAPMSKTDLHKQVSLSFDQGTLLLTDQTRNQLPETSGSCIWRWDTRVGTWRCDAIYYSVVFKTLSERFGENFSDEVMKPQTISFPKVNLPKLRSEQTEALTAWRQAGCRGQIIMPTGTGKTEVALAAMVQTKTATLVVAPVRDLMYQWHRRILRAFDVDAGIVGDGLSNIKPVTVTTYDSAYIHMAKMGAGFGLLIFDEEHHLPGKCRREAAILRAYPNNPEQRNVIIAQTK